MGERIQTVLLDLKEKLLSKIIGQDHVIDPVVQFVKNGELGLTDPGRPKANFLFLGPTGTGKTELTKQLTEAIHGSQSSLLRFDMSEYQTKESLESLLGNSSGYNGRLGEALLRYESGVLLFDEMEKAHRDMMDIFLQMLDAARVTTGKGITHDLSGFYIILTSNVGSEKLMDSRTAPSATIKKAIMSSLIQAGFRPEFVGRFHEIIVFNSLTYPVIEQIAKLTIKREVARMATVFSKRLDENVTLEFEKSLVRESMRLGYNPRLGARPMRNAVERLIQNASADAILKDISFSKGCFITEGDKTILEPLVITQEITDQKLTLEA